ncbi:GNAT family N-acetyltransferase [Terrisporobacter sp.]
MENILIEELNEAQINEALFLVWKVFKDYEAPDYSKEGVDEFYKSINDESYLSMLRVFGAFKDDNLLGVIATRSEGTHIALFFVDGRYHRRGIGKALFQTVLKYNPSNKMTVNSSPYAVEVYHKLGFCDTDKEQLINGIIFTPMELEL